MDKEGANSGLVALKERLQPVSISLGEELGRFIGGFKFFYWLKGYFGGIKLLSDLQGVIGFPELQKVISECCGQPGKTPPELALARLRGFSAAVSKGNLSLRSVWVLLLELDKLEKRILEDGNF